MSKRIPDYYGWTNLFHWKISLQEEAVRWANAPEEKPADDALLYAMVKTLIFNCCPISIICCCMQSNEKFLLHIGIWKDVMQFINGKRKIKRDCDWVYFTDLEDDEQSAILNAHVHSIWMKCEGEQEMADLSKAFSFFPICFYENADRSMFTH